VQPEDLGKKELSVVGGYEDQKKRPAKRLPRTEATNSKGGENDLSLSRRVTGNTRRAHGLAQSGFRDARGEKKKKTSMPGPGTL